MLNKLGSLYNDAADLLIGGLAGASIYSAFSHAATGREMASAVIITASMAVIAGSRVWGNKSHRESEDIKRSKPSP